MQQLKFENTNSESIINQINPTLFLKISDPCNCSAGMGAPQINVLARLSDVAKQRSRAQEYVPKGQIELLNLLDISKLGEIFYG